MNSHSFLQLRAGLDPIHIREPVHTIEVPYVHNKLNRCVPCLAASKCGLMAVLEEINQKLFIYNHERKEVLGFPLNYPEFTHANQMAFDMYNNIIIAQSDRDTLLRFNMNGKALPHLVVPVENPTGVACSPEGDIFVSADCPRTILKKAVGQSKWVNIYRYQELQDDEESDYWDEFDPTQFTPGQMSVGSGCELFVATDNCINVLSTFDGKLKRQIGCDRYRDGELSKVEGIFATGDGYLFVCSDDHNVHVFTTDGNYLSKFGVNEDGPRRAFQQPFGIAVDWNGYLFISDLVNGDVQVF